MKPAKWIVLGVGIFIFLLGYASLESKPETMYATKPYGRGIVKETNPVGKGMKTIGALTTLVGGLWVWVDHDNKKK